MNDSLAKLLEYLEPKIKDIHENRVELKSLSDVYETISEIVNLGEKSYLDIIDYYDQEFVIKAIKISGDDITNRVNKYKTSRYLLKNQDSSLKELPQYKESINFMESLFRYLYGLYEDIKLEYENKQQKLGVQEILNKYYLLLRKNNIFIENISEFITFLDLCEINPNDKLNILIFITKCNIKNYTTTNDIMITNDIKLSDIENLLNKYKEFYSKKIENNEKLELNIKDLLKTPNKNILLDKKNYLYNKINNLFLDKNYDELIKYYLEFNDVLDYEKEFIKQETRFSEDLSKKLVFVMEDDKSLVREFLSKTKLEYKSPVYKNLLDIENESDLIIPNYRYNNIYLYIKDEFVVKTVSTYLENGYVLILGVMEKDEKIEEFLEKNKNILKNLNKIINQDNFDLKERDLILGNTKLEDLVLTIDLNTLDIKNGGEYAR